MTPNNRSGRSGWIWRASLGICAATLHLPGAWAGASVDPGHLASARFTQIVVRLQDLGYLPLTQAAVVWGIDAQGQTLTQRHDAFAFPVPATLQAEVDQSAWGPSNPWIQGALISFNRVNGRARDGQYAHAVFDADTLAALQSPTAQSDPWPWTWVLVDKRTGTRNNETLQVWQAPTAGHPGGFVFATPVSTGVLDATTSGTWPIYRRLPSTTMRGAFPHPISLAQYQKAQQAVLASETSGPKPSVSVPPVGLFRGHPVRWVPYNDPGILWVSYFHAGQALHFYPRARYGFEQSAGCVEQPLAAARTVYRLVHDGVPVSVVDHEAPQDAPRQTR